MDKDHCDFDSDCSYSYECIKSSCTYKSRSSSSDYSYTSNTSSLPIGLIVFGFIGVLAICSCCCLCLNGCDNDTTVAVSRPVVHAPPAQRQPIPQRAPTSTATAPYQPVNHAPPPPENPYYQAAGLANPNYQEDMPPPYAVAVNCAPVQKY